MSDASGDSRVEQLAESFVARYRRGERPSIAEYTRRYPELATEIQEVFPALAAIEQAQQDLQEISPQSAVPAPPPVSTLGDFRIIREIGRGGMGIVYEAEQVTLGRRVALKVLAGSLLDHDKNRKRFAREARAAAQLHHTNIVPVFGVGEQDDVAYYVMQLIHGLGLDDVLAEISSDQRENASTVPRRLRQPALAGQVTAEFQQCAVGHLADMVLSGQFEQTVLLRGGGDSSSLEATDQTPIVTDVPDEDPELRDTATIGLSGTGPHAFAYALPGQSEATSHVASPHAYWQSVARIGLQVAEALDYAHQQGLCHRDIKPANLLLDMHGTVWVTDFGLAKAADHQNLTQTGDVVGTLRYIAPEQFTGKCDERSDVYSLGLTLYELLALRPAYDQTDRQQLLKAVMSDAPPRLRTLNPRLPQDLTTIVHKAIERDPSHRYQSAGELADDLQRYLNDEPIRARRVSLPARLRRWYRRNPTIAWLTTAMGVLVTTTAVVASVAALRFEKLATDNADLAAEKSRLADDLHAALETSKETLTLANEENSRAERNLELALESLDAVYMDAIGTEKLLAQAAVETPSDVATIATETLSELEKSLLRVGLTFYEQFALLNLGSSKAEFRVASAYHRVGLIHAGLLEFDEAREAVGEAIARLSSLTEKSPENAAYWLALGSIRVELGQLLENQKDAVHQYEQAIDEYDIALTLGERTAHLYTNRARTRVLARQPNELVIADYEAALEQDTANIRALEHLVEYTGWRDPKTRNVEKALDYAKRLLRIDPENARAHRIKATLDPDPGERRIWLSRWLDRHPQDPMVHICAADAAISERQHQVAIGHLDAASAVNAASDQIAIMKAWNLCEMSGRRIEVGQFDRAVEDAKLAVELDPNNWFIRGMLGEAYRHRGDLDEALAALTQSIEMSQVGEGSRTHFYFRRAQVHWEMKQYHAAVDDLTSLLKHFPQNGALHVAIPPPDIWRVSDPEITRRVLELMQMAIDAPESPESLARGYRAHLFAELGRWDEALTELAAAWRTARDDSECEHAVKWRSQTILQLLLESDWLIEKDNFERAQAWLQRLDQLLADHALASSTLKDKRDRLQKRLDKAVLAQD